MGSVSAVRSGLETRLATIAGLNATDTAPATPNLPAAFPIPGPNAPIEYDETMGRGADLLRFTIVLLVVQTTTELAQRALDEYLAGSGAKSIKAAVEGDETLGGAADWARVPRCASYGVIEHAGIQYLGARFDVEVSVDGS